MQAKTIDEVIKALDAIIDETKKQNSPLGYFAALYRKVTLRVKEGIQNGEFQDGQRMEKLDVIFANRYLDAFNQYSNNLETTKSWQIAFDYGNKFWPIVLQHLLLGMNAHINLDLGIAAVETVLKEEQPLGDLEQDFNKINQLLAELVDDVEKELSQIWPALKYLLKFFGKVDDFLINFSMKQAREGAWKFANAYYIATNREQLLTERDVKVAGIASYIMPSSLLLRIIFGLIRLGEKGTVKKKIEILE